MEKATANGARVTMQEKDADIKIADHLQKEPPPGLYSYQWIERSIRKNTLLDLEEFRIGIKSRADRPVGSVRTPASTNARRPFTEAEDQALYNFVQPFKERGGAWKGNEIYKQMEKKYPTHTFQSWRDRFIRKVDSEKRTITEQIDPEGYVAEPVRAEGGDISLRPAKRRRVQFETDAKREASTSTAATVRSGEHHESGRVETSSDRTTDLPKERQEKRREMAPPERTTYQAEEHDESGRAMTSPRRGREQVNEHHESTRVMASSEGITARPESSSVHRPPLAEIPSPSNSRRPESIVNRDTVTTSSRESVSRSPRSAGEPSNDATGELKFLRTGQVHGFSREEVKMLYRALPTIISAPASEVESGWTAFAEDRGTYSVEVWRNFFDYTVVPEFMRRNKLKTEEQFHAQVNKILAAANANKEETDADCEEFVEQQAINEHTDEEDSADNEEDSPGEESADHEESGDGPEYQEEEFRSIREQPRARPERSKRLQGTESSTESGDSDEKQRRMELKRAQQEMEIESSTDSVESDFPLPRPKLRCTVCHIELLEAEYVQDAKAYCTDCAWSENIEHHRGAVVEESPRIIHESEMDEERSADDHAQVDEERQSLQEDGILAELATIDDKTSHNEHREHSPVFEPQSPSQQRLTNPKPNEGRKRASQSTNSNSLSQNSQSQTLPLGSRSQNPDEGRPEDSSHEIPSTEVEAPSSVTRQRSRLNIVLSDDEESDSDSLASDDDHDTEDESGHQVEPEAQSSGQVRPSQNSVVEDIRRSSISSNSTDDNLLQPVVSQEPPESGQRPPKPASSAQLPISAPNEVTKQQGQRQSGSESPLFVSRSSQDDDYSDNERQLPRSPPIDLLGEDEIEHEIQPASSPAGVSDTESEYFTFEEGPERSQLWTVDPSTKTPSEEDSSPEDQFETARHAEEHSDSEDRSETEGPVDEESESEDRFETARQVHEHVNHVGSAKRERTKDTQAILRQPMEPLEDLTEHFLPPPDGGWDGLSVDETDMSNAWESDNEKTPRKVPEVNETPQSQRHTMRGALQESVIDRDPVPGTSAKVELAGQQENRKSSISVESSSIEMEDDTSSTVTDDSEQAKRDNEWFDEQQDRLIHHNLDEDMAYYMVSAAYMATCMKTAFATTVLNRMMNIYQVKENREHRSLQIGDEQTAREFLPKDLPGCWTGEDDRTLMGKDARGIAKMERKHGERNAKIRVTLLEDLHNGR